MTSAFMGYVLPWGQMSFWGCTVITNLLSTVPGLVPWICGGFLMHFWVVSWYPKSKYLTSSSKY